MNVCVFDIKRYAVNDGPGIRTTLFFKGCPLRCVWCHNPESWEREPEILFKQNKCIGCNTCGLYPDQLHELFCSHPSAPSSVMDDGIHPHLLSDQYQSAITNCPACALEQCGREWSVEELMDEVEKEREVMMSSGGGVTSCGGEPLMQPQAALEVLKELGRRGLHRAVDTSLYASEETVKAIAAETDLFLVDLKHMDTEQHRLLTGRGNECILSNVRLLADSSCDIWFRIPLIEGVNADEENIVATARFIDSLHTPSPRVHLLPYHDIGKDKHIRRGTRYNPDGLMMKEPANDCLDRCADIFSNFGITTVIGG